MARTKKWVFSPKRREALRSAQIRHVELVEAGKKALGYRSSTKRVRVARNARSGN